ncbi:phage major capsid protein [Paraburkholderia phenoliruptrix]|uniref:phage major capsid protein n=1 Tax=Paraburkholderia phenoliruptrix TaxID=252970 RepID=UPI001C6EB853|nr:phage major capsid protein [Paraburkholderia phenoliruptrix]MBW9107773.1 phage major capsid protein [Paraburkholderia phenoliruptrix]MBW9132991.1 phage major capsid protein [Paraburkholderia ginsengiterrae]
MHSFTQKPIARGIQSVRAEGGNPNDVRAALEAMTGAFAAFKEKHQGEVAELREAMDGLAIAAAAQQMNGGGAAARTEQQPIYAAPGMRAAEIAAHYKQAAKAADEDTGITMGDFMRGVAGMKTTEGVKASLAVGTDTAGGFSVPNVVMPTILDALVDQSALLSAGASIIPVGEGGKSFTTAGIDTLPVPAWRNELGAIAETDPTLRPIVATPRSLACIVRFSRELLADSTDISRAVTQAISQAFALELDRVGLVGSGTAPEPLGLYGMEAVTKIEQIGATFGYADMLAAYRTQLEHKAPAPTAAIMAPRTLTGLAGMVDTTGQPLNAPPLLSTVRQLSTNGVPTNLGTGTNKSLVFVGNFSTVQYVMRERLNIGVLREAYAKTGEIGFLCHARVDVVAYYPQAITVIEGVASAAA